MTAVFVDRTESLDALAHVADALVEGHSGVLVIEGESGMGKSSLLVEFVRRVTADEALGCRVVLVRCTPGIGTRRPYGPVMDALHQLCPPHPPAPSRRAWWGRAVGRSAMAAAPDVLSAAVPGLGMLFAAGREFAEAAVTSGSIPGDSLGPIQTTVTQQVVEALLEQARAAAPLLLIIDDVQLCDVTTLELLHLLLPRLGDEPLSLVLGLGSAPSTAANAEAVGQLLRVWRDDHRELLSGHVLRPLPGWAVRELVESRLHSYDVPADFADRLADATAGQPIFVEQCLKLWRPTDGADVPLPHDLPAAVADRIGQLDERSRELLVIGATMGEFFFSHTVAEIAGLPHSQVQDLLHRIEREHGLIRERHAGDVPPWASHLHTDWYDFEHRILQYGIRGGQSRGARLGRHGRLADALCELPGSEPLPRELRVLIADQLYEAGRARAEQSAAAHYALARSVAVNELSFTQAEQHCRTAIESARLLTPGTPERDRRLLESIELLLSLTEVRWRGGTTGTGGSNSSGTSDIDSLAAEAEQAAHRLEDPLLIARATLQRGKTLMAVRGLQPSLAKLEEAVRRARAYDGPGRAATLFMTMVEYGRQLPKRNLVGGLQVLFEAEELYASHPGLGATGNPVLQHARNLNEMQIGVSLFDSGRIGEARERLVRCADRLRAEPFRAELPIALNYLAQLYLATGSYTEAETVLRDALGFEEDRGGVSGWHAYNNALLALCAAHDPARRPEVLERIRAAWQETEQTWLASLVPIVRNFYAEVLLQLDEDRDLAHRLVDHTLNETRETGMVRSEIAAYSLRSRIRLAAGDTDLATQDARQALALLAEHGDLPALRTEEILHDAARALLASGARDEAQALLARARAEVLRKADTIDDPDLRGRFLSVVPLNHVLLEELNTQDPRRPV
ncbi:AAA family ATPase [Streptomyces sp. JH14]|uniref:AAA family ATPase n=1 Tax=Streptomyces sp. JH14 TaxID=2793630 RepID=UPI0023F8210E|nr:AAA family ATPase [Streptomyces sp. JH14]MDF6046383.1 AAA family ATPase [Streptomyces sp. JH14]